MLTFSSSLLMPDNLYPGKVKALKGNITPEIKRSEIKASGKEKWPQAGDHH